MERAHAFLLENRLKKEVVFIYNVSKYKHRLYEPKYSKYAQFVCVILYTIKDMSISVCVGRGSNTHTHTHTVLIFLWEH